MRCAARSTLTVVWIVLITNALNLCDASTASRRASGSSAWSSWARRCCVRDIRRRRFLRSCSPARSRASRLQFNPASIFWAMRGARHRFAMATCRSPPSAKAPYHRSRRSSWSPLPARTRSSPSCGASSLAVSAPGEADGSGRASSRGSAHRQSGPPPHSSRLSDLGFSQRRAVLLLYGAAPPRVGSPTSLGKAQWPVDVVVLMLTVAVIWVGRLSLRRAAAGALGPLPPRAQQTRPPSAPDRAGRFLLVEVMYGIALALRVGAMRSPRSAQPPRPDRRVSSRCSPSSTCTAPRGGGGGHQRLRAPLPRLRRRDDLRLPWRPGLLGLPAAAMRRSCTSCFSSRP